MNKTKSKSNNKVIINRMKFLQRVPRQLAIQRFIPIPAFYPHFSVLSPFQRFIPNSALYPHFSVLSPFQRFIPISAFYPQFSVLSPFQFPFSVSVSTIQFQRFIPTRQNRYKTVSLCLNFEHKKTKSKYNAFRSILNS